MGDLFYKAMAKINLGLDVVRKREDGYHEVKMIMQNVYLFDSVLLSRNSESDIVVDTNLPFLPTDKNNLVYKAADLLREEFGIDKGLKISLRKHIPVAAGMAGGSADAAAVMVGVNRMFHLGLSQEELMKRAVKIGADVPYCIMRGTALSEGIGEILTPLPAPPPCHVLIAKPGVSVSTKFVYSNLKLSETTIHPDIDGMIEAIKAQDIKGMCSRMGNVLETVTIPAYPIIGSIKETMMNCGALGSLMSGSGPTVFGLFENANKARECMNEIKKNQMAKQVFLTTFFIPKKVGKMGERVY